MKTSTLLSVFFFIFASVQISGQHNHLMEELENHFDNHSLLVFEQDLQLAAPQLQNPDIQREIDNAYQAFFQSIRSRLVNQEEISPEQFESAYEELVENTRSGLSKGSPNHIPPILKVADGPCVNMDFETGDLSGWTLTRGDVNGAQPYSFVNEIPAAPGAYHQITGPGFDPVCGIPTVGPTGGNFSVRLGNGTGVGARAARMKQTFLVDSTNFMFRYSYAVVFESPAGHGLNQQPYFTVRVTDSLGNNVPCGEYSVIADAQNAPNYQSIVFGGTTVLFKDWETVFTNLSTLIGQNVTIEFTSGDCSLSGHFGYAYVDATCAMDQILVSNPIICTGGTSVLTAPAGADTYLWSTGETTQSITVTAGGNYTCTLTPFQGSGCSFLMDVDVTEYPTPVADFTISVNTLCQNENVVFTNNSSIVNPGVIAGYVWDFGDGTVTPQGLGVINGVNNTSGTYLQPDHQYTTAGQFSAMLWVYSADGCVDSTNQTITVNALPVVTAGPDQAVCDGVPVTVNGGGASSYVWNPFVTDGVPFLAPVGNTIYTVTGTDANGCQSTDQLQITVYSLPIVGAGIDQEVCEGTAVILTGSGATNYAWTNGVIDNTAFTPAVGTQIYTVTGTDNNGCSNTDQVEVVVNPLPQVIAGNDVIVCENEFITLTAQGAQSYQWNPAIQNGVPFTQPVGVQIYQVVGTDDKGCQATDQLQVTVNPNPVVDAGPDQTICLNEWVTLNATGANSYQWTNNVQQNVAFQPGLGTNTYQVTGTNNFGCSAVDDLIVTVHPLPNTDAGQPIAVCDGEFVTLTASGADQYQWTNGVQNGIPFIQGIGVVLYHVTGTTAFGCSTQDSVEVTVYALPLISADDVTVCEGQAAVLNAQGATSYFWSGGISNGQPFYPSLSEFYYVTGTDANGCSNTDSAWVTVNPTPSVYFTINNLELTTIDPTTGFTNLSQGASTYEWQFSDNSPSVFAFEPTHTFPGDESGSYEITLIGSTPEGCADTLVKYIHVFQDYTIYVPNAFTPDGNGKNEIFLPIMEGFDESKYTLLIFNRWGEIVFESHDMQVGWDGTYPLSDPTVQDGVFTWKIEAGLKDSADYKVFVGHVALLR